MRSSRPKTNVAFVVVAALLVATCSRPSGVRAAEDARPAATAIETLGKALHTWADLIEPADGATPKKLSGTVTVTRAGGLPKDVAGAKATFALQAPDRLNLTATVDGKQYRIGRDGQQ